ncbi:MAG: fluoride efflux transporter CrcB [Anaerolineales bacterium]|nr:fluoride efflux transporter CrcB [Anaerolineales bacterium]
MPLMQKILLIGLGGGLGAILRYYLGGYVQQQAANNFTFPIGTVGVNLLGCLVIGLLSELAETRSLFTPETRLFVFIGLLGGFTTFSTFGNESVNLLRDGENRLAFGYVALHVFGGLGAVWLGRILADLIWR